MFSATRTTFQGLVVIVFAGTVLNGCGGSGSSDGPTPQSPSSPPPPQVVGLTMPDNFSIISAQGEGSDSASATLAAVPSAAAASLADFPVKAFDDPDTAYSLEEADVYVYDDSMQSLNLINEIVCYMGQTAASEMVNEGPYIALVNEDRCKQGQTSGSTAETGQSSSDGGTEFARWVLESSRANNDSPQVVQIWVPDSGDRDPGEPEQTILVEVSVTEGVSASLPFGSFSMNFKGVIDGADVGFPGTEIEAMRGMLASVENDEGQPQFRFINLGGDSLDPNLDFGYGFAESANVRLGDADGTTGLALTHNAQQWSFEGPGGLEEGESQQTFAIDYDETRFLSARDVDGDDIGDELICRARDEFDTHVWRYNLYHADDGEFRGNAVTGGARVQLNSGFPFSYDSDDDAVADSYGWLGYHGVWTESGAALSDATVVTHYDYQTEVSKDYVLRVASGRLTRRSSNQELLTAFIGDEFEYWGEHPTLGIFGQWRVVLSENADFMVLSTIEWGNDGPTYSDAVDDDNDPSTPDVAVAAAFSLQDNEVLVLWSQALGGDVVYTHSASTAVQERVIRFFSEEFVDASDSTLFPGGTTDVTLNCYDQCLIGGLTQADVDAAVDSSALFHPYSGTPLNYTLSANDGKVVLTDDSNGRFVDTSNLDMSALGFDWGIHTGEMITGLLADPNQPWLVFDEAVTYRWETGPNNWNQMVTATDENGALVTFDRPLQISYVHTQANDANGNNEFDGKRFLLEYNGPGDLHGFPWVSEGNADRWYPAIALADGTLLDDFVVKGLEKEQSMREIAPGECAALDVSQAYADSSLALPTIDDIGTVSITLADRPVVTAPPAVIEGAVQ